jgi:hypothetical protein
LQEITCFDGPSERRDAEFLGDKVMIQGLQKRFETLTGRCAIAAVCASRRADRSANLMRYCSPINECSARCARARRSGR